VVGIVAGSGLAGSVRAQSLVFSTNDPDLKMGAAARVEATNGVEIEAADDFLLAGDTRLTSADIVGLIPADAALTDVQQVVVEIYRIFPLDSDLSRTARVPTRNNSPGDVAFLTRDSADTGLNFSVIPLAAPVTALNSVINGINPSPSQTTQGEGPVDGQEVKIVVNFATPIDLRQGHYFFVPQVKLASGTFLWLSAPKPIVAPGTPFNGDLQAWIRSGRLAPDWLRIGADIVGGSPAPAFNMASSWTACPSATPTATGPRTPRCSTSATSPASSAASQRAIPTPTATRAPRPRRSTSTTSCAS
jgi:hypothetical protein